MAVLRDFECEGCRTVRELRAEPYELVLCCGRAMRSIISLPRPQVPVAGMFPFWHPHLGHNPVQVNSWSHYKQLLKARNASNELAS